MTIDEGNAKVSTQHQHDKCGREEVDNTIQSGNMKTATTQRRERLKVGLFSSEVV